MSTGFRRLKFRGAYGDCYQEIFGALINIFKRYNRCWQLPLLDLAGRVQLGREEQFGDSLDCNMEIIQLLCHLHKGIISEES